MLTSADHRVTLVGSPAELPDLRSARTVYLDGETTGLEAYKGHRLCGVAVCTEDPTSPTWYVPVRHRRGTNVPEDAFRRWLSDTLAGPGDWVNHNVKFDAHMAWHDGVDVLRGRRMIDTLVLAKFLETDRRVFGLKELSRDWLGDPMEEETAILAWLKDAGFKKKGKKAGGYDHVPVDLMGRYAGKDVIATRALHEYVLSRLDPELDMICDQEIALTPILWRMENDGLLVDTETTQVEQFVALRRMLEISERITNLTGIEFSDSTKCLVEIMIGRYNLPILDRTDAGQPAFDKDTLVRYQGHPDVVCNVEVREVVELLLAYRVEEIFKGLYCDSFLDKMDDHGRVHPSYNQIVRTGRMSCSRPNSQQMSKRAKKLIVPGQGMSFLSLDASQIEFRLIVHYCRDQRAIDAYRADPKTDFHRWMAALCQIDRDPAKNVNFAVGYGAGRNRITSMLATNKTIMASIPPGPDYGRLVAARAGEIYERWHAEFPNKRIVSQRAEEKCRRVGYVRNAYRRRRHLPPKAAHKAFNSVVQGTAGDYVKERMVAVEPVALAMGIRQAVNVHDELLFVGPSEVIEDPRTEATVREVLERQEKAQFLVPLLWKAGTPSRVSWADAGD